MASKASLMSLTNAGSDANRISSGDSQGIIQSSSSTSTHGKATDCTGSLSYVISPLLSVLVRGLPEAVL
ncbi:hypothetical protein ACFVVU_08995 [Kitasatospora sp. NPDC057965]|uniref:hypothetical protein n=1 Tax=Kitasatospora sp. NPDC057965 TaxID=3346291 RepID=UPI0036D9ED03